MILAVAVIVGYVAIVGLSLRDAEPGDRVTFGALGLFMFIGVAALAGGIAGYLN